MIYCVEDDDSIRELMVYALRASNVEAKGFVDGGELFQALQIQRPDLITLDIMLPGMDGVEILKKLRSSPDTEGIPVIMASAKGTEYDKVMGLDLGADDYLVKPFKVERVLKTLEKARDRLSPERDEAPLPHHAAQSPAKPAGRMMLHHREGVTFINMEDIVLVQREDRATVIYTRDGGRYVTGDSLAETEARLDPAVFFRCHKSYIINLNHISNITPYGRWTYVVRLSGITQDALITHEKYEELEQLFS